MIRNQWHEGYAKKKRQYKGKIKSTEEENDKEMEKKKKEETEIDGGGWKRALHMQTENRATVWSNWKNCL